MKPPPRSAFGWLHEGAFGGAGPDSRGHGVPRSGPGSRPRLAAAWVSRRRPASSCATPRRRPARSRRPQAAPDDPRSGTEGLLLAERRALRGGGRRFDRALALEPRHAASWSDRGKALGVLKRHEETVESLERAIVVCPDAPAPWLNKALAEERGPPRGCGALYRMFLERAPAGQELQVEAAKDRLAILEPLVRESCGKAYAATARAALVPPAMAPLPRDAPPAMAPPAMAPAPAAPAPPGVDRGLEALRAGRFEEAVALLRAVAGPHGRTPPTGPTSASAKRLGRPGDALAAYDKALALDDRNVAALTNKAALITGRAADREEPALDLLTRTSASRPRQPLVWVNLAVSHAALGVHELAVDACDKALGLNPQDAEALEVKADSLARMKRPAESLAAAEQALGLEPARAHAWYLKANALAKLGRKDDCLAAYDRCLELDPPRPTPASTRPTSSSS